jgi:hypothetical protein
VGHGRVDGGRRRRPLRHGWGVVVVGFPTPNRSDHHLKRVRQDCDQYAAANCFASVMHIGLIVVPTLHTRSNAPGLAADAARTVTVGSFAT